MSQNPLDLFEHSLMQKVLGLLRASGIKGGKVSGGSVAGPIPLTSLPAHQANHANAGSDELSVAGLSGELADAQPVAVQDEGIAIGTRTMLNFIGSGVVATLDGTRINITISVGVSGGDLLTDDDGNILTDDDADLLSQDAA